MQRAIAELVRAGLLTFAGWMQGRYKKYALAWKNFLTKASQKCRTTPDTNVVRPATPVSDDARHQCQPIIREAEQSSKQITTPQSILEQYGDNWRTRFSCLDGQAGRPRLEDCIAQALSHRSRHNYDDISVFLEMWLHNAAARWPIPTTEGTSSFESLKAWEIRSKELTHQRVLEHFGQT